MQMAREKRTENGNSRGRGKAAPGMAKAGKGAARKPRKSVRAGARKSAPGGRSKRGRTGVSKSAGFPLYHVAAFLSGIVLGRLVIR